MLFDISGLSNDLQNQIKSNPKLVSMFSRFPDSLFSVGNDAKTVKGEKRGVVTAILYFAPYNISGVNLCPNAEKAGCVNACLFTAGRGAFSSVFFARLRKTLYYIQYRNQFINQLISEIHDLRFKANNGGVVLHVRLNGTSDIVWEKKHPEIFDRCPDVQFYDYTKIPNRKTPSNYDLTFSYSGVVSFQKENQKAIRNGERIAVVFKTKEMIPASFAGLNVIDGDDTDIRAYDPRGVIVALYAKGKAKSDNSGFVVSV